MTLSACGAGPRSRRESPGHAANHADLAQCLRRFSCALIVLRQRAVARTPGMGASTARAPLLSVKASTAWPCTEGGWPLSPGSSCGPGVRTRAALRAAVSPPPPLSPVPGWKKKPPGPLARPPCATARGRRTGAPRGVPGAPWPPGAPRRWASRRGGEGGLLAAGHAGHESTPFFKAAGHDSAGSPSGSVTARAQGPSLRSWLS